MARGWHYLPILCLLLVSLSGAREMPGSQNKPSTPKVVQENSDVPGQQQGSQIPIDSNIKKVGDDVRGQVQDEAALLAIWEPFLFTRLTSLSDFQIPNPLAGSNGRFQSSSTNGQFQTGNGQFKTSNGQFQNGNGQFQPNNGQFQASNGLFESFFFGR